MRAMRRADRVAVLERAADADGDRLLADVGVEESRQVAGAEALLDLLLEAPDQQHLARGTPRAARAGAGWARRSKPGPGRPVTMDVHGPACVAAHRAAAGQPCHDGAVAAAEAPNLDAVAGEPVGDDTARSRARTVMPPASLASHAIPRLRRAHPKATLRGSPARVRGRSSGRRLAAP